MKVRQISSEQDIDSIIQSLDLSAERAVSQLAKAMTGSHAMQALWSMKFSSIGCNPLSVDTPLNLIEQVNQTFTYLASARAVRLLFRLHPELAPFTVNLGTAKGSDIESAAQGGLAAEVFAAVRPTNNHKLAKDLEKVGRATAQLKYVFFMCPGYEEGRQHRLERDGISVWSVGHTL